MPSPVPEDPEVPEVVIAVDELPGSEVVVVVAVVVSEVSRPVIVCGSPVVAMNSGLSSRQPGNRRVAVTRAAHSTGHAREPANLSPWLTSPPIGVTVYQ